MGITMTDEKSIIDLFKQFHENPELSFEEYETTKRICKALQAGSVETEGMNGIEILDLPLETGLIARVTGTKEAWTEHIPAIALRCDIDALPVQEETNLSYASRIPGKMHACGHDFHTSAVIGTALEIAKRREEFAGEIYFIFQPGEESSYGALKIIETGIIDRLDAIYGLHVTPSYPVGTYAIKDGATSASVDTFHITIHGKGSHAGHPELAIDPIVTAAGLVTTLQTVISRNINPFEPGLLSITHIESGSTWNVIPETAFLEGTVRTTSRESRALIEKRLKEVSEATAAGYGATADVEWLAGPPSTDNDPALAEFARQFAAAQGHTVVWQPPTMGGEDFSFYQERTKGVMILVGTGISESLHNPGFRADPQALPGVVDYFTGLLLETLKENRG